MPELKLYLHDYLKFYLEFSDPAFPRFHQDFYNFVSFFNQKTRYSEVVKKGIWDGRTSFYNRERRLLPIGLYDYLTEFCNRLKIRILPCFDKGILRDTLEEPGFSGYLASIFKGIKLRDYQLEAIKVALERKRGVICAATSSGKSAQIYAISRFLVEVKRKKVLIIVPTIGLVEQLFENFREYGYLEAPGNVCRLMGGRKLEDKPIVISTYQSFVDQDKEVFEGIGAVIVDEAHLAKGASIQKILKKCTEADYRLGFTGTLPRDPYEKVQVTSFLGPKIYEVKTEQLQEVGFVAKCKVINLILKYDQRTKEFLKNKGFEWPFDDSGEKYDLDNIPESFHEFYKAHSVNYMKRIVNRKILPYYVESGLINYNQKRMKSLEYVYARAKWEDNVLILVQELSHFREVSEFIKDRYVKPERLFLINGEVSPEERERIRKLSESRVGVTIVATFGTMSTGISITSISHVVLFKSFRSETRVLQSIGRGLRLNPNKETCLIWDVVDDLSDPGDNFFNFGLKHWMGKALPGNGFGRLDYYKEQGFPLEKLIVNLSE